MSKLVLQIRSSLADNCKEMFAKMDSNGDGKLTWDEFKAQAAADTDPEQLQEEWDSFEPKDGIVDLASYTQCLLLKFDFKVSNITASAQEQWDCYEKKDAKASITMDSFLKVQTERGTDIPLEQLKEMFVAIDTDKDGQVSFDEYLTAMIMEQM